MSSGAVSVTLKNTKRMVEDLKDEKGFTIFCITLHFIIKDYFRLRSKIDESRDAAFKRVCDLIAGKEDHGFNQAVIEDLNELKNSVTEIRNMIAIVGKIDSGWLG